MEPREPYWSIANTFAVSVLLGTLAIWSRAPIYVFGSEPQLYFYAHRRSASRYIFVYPLMLAFPDIRERQAGVVRELTERPPRFVVTVDNECSFLSDPASPTLLRVELQRMLTDSYRIVGYVARREVQARTPEGAPPPGQAKAEMVIWERTAGR